MNRLMETKRYRYCISLCFALGLLLVGSAARGQDAQANMEKQFAALQAGLGNIEKTGRITAAFDIDIAIDTYLEAAHAAFREATSAVEADSKAGKNAGGLAKLKSFESKVQKHKTAFDKIVDRITAVNVMVRQGKVVFDTEVLKKATPEDIQDLKNWLTPAAREKYRKIDPRITAATDDARIVQFAALTTCDLPAASRQITVRDYLLNAPYERSWLRSVLDDGSNLIVSPAHASIGGGCVGICTASLGLMCGICVAGAPVAVLGAWEGYQSALRKCGKCHWYKPWACVCRAAAAASFLAALA